MISIFGEISLLFAIFFATVQSIVPLWGYAKKNSFAIACARPAAIGQFVCVCFSYLLLTSAFITNDFSIAYVVANSHSSLPLLYRVTAVWGAHEGSILLWILILATWSIVFSINHFKPMVLAILGLISLFFLIFILLTSDPFTAAQAWQSPQDLNPLLQDPGFIFHPPLLYMGYVGFSTAFAITMAGLLQDSLNREWIRTAENYALYAWCFLTFGIILGSWWAYRVLGWGGFWFWDPVENASLLPWLTGLAFIHVLLLAEKRNTAKSWAVLLGIASFSLSLLGTFLVRSGVLISAHAFASDPSRGLFLLILLTFVLFSTLVIYLKRTPASNNLINFPLLSREAGLLINSALLIIAMATILLGTLYPLIVDALHLGNVSVGAPYFNLVMLPIVFIALFTMGASALCRWHGHPWHEWWHIAYKKLLISITIATALMWFLASSFDWMSVTGIALSFWVILSILPTLYQKPGMSLAHLGFAILIIGIILSSTLNHEREVRIKPGITEQVGPYQFLLVDVTGINGSNYRAVRAKFDIFKNTHHVASLYPEKRLYSVRDMVMTKVAIHPGIFSDLYIALGEPLNDNYWSARIHYKPFIRWIWFGGILMIIGGIFATTTRRKFT